MTLSPVTRAPRPSPIRGQPRRGNVGNRLIHLFAVDTDLSEWVLTNATFTPVEASTVGLTGVGGQLGKLSPVTSGGARARGPFPEPQDLTTAHLRVRYYVPASESPKLTNVALWLISSATGSYAGERYRSGFPTTPGWHCLEITSAGLNQTFDPNGNFDMAAVGSVQFSVTGDPGAFVYLDEISVWHPSHDVARIYFTTDGSRVDLYRHIAPALEARGWLAQLQISRHDIALNQNYMTLDQLLELYDRGHGVGSYRGNKLPGYPDLPLAAHQRIMLDVKEWLEDLGMTRTHDVMSLPGETPEAVRRSGWRDFVRKNFRAVINGAQYDPLHGSWTELRPPAVVPSGAPNAPVTPGVFQRNVSDNGLTPEFVDAAIAHKGMLGVLLHGVSTSAPNHISASNLETVLDHIKAKEETGEVEVWTVEALIADQ